MSAPIKIINIVGARPNFMKIAPLVHEMGRHREIESLLVHTGQHYDDNLSRIFFDDLRIPRPALDLGIGSGSREEQIRRIQAVFDPVVRRERPDLVLVVGDVNSTIACAEVARRHRARVAHVEAGLRSFDLSMPEEHNRRETDRISDYLFVTEASGLRNIEQEGVPGKAFMVGNVMIDALIANLDRARESRILDTLGLEKGAYMVATFHRPSNVDRASDLRQLLETLAAVCRRGTLVLPLHPRTRHSLESHRLSADIHAIENLRLTEPLGYVDFLRLLTTAKAVITDSGGIQEETTWLGIPCLTMRDSTERPVTITIGTNVLVGSDFGALLRALDKITRGEAKTGEVPPLWDGRAAARIVAILLRELGARDQGGSE